MSIDLGRRQLARPAMVFLRGESLTYRINQMKLLNAIAATAVIGTTLNTAPARAFGLGTLINAAAGASVVQPVVAPQQSSSNGSHATGLSGASGGNGTNVSGQGNTVSTQQVTNIHHHHYTTNTTKNNTNFTTNAH